MSVMRSYANRRGSFPGKIGFVGFTSRAEPPSKPEGRDRERHGEFGRGRVFPSVELRSRGGLGVLGRDVVELPGMTQMIAGERGTSRNDRNRSLAVAARRRLTRREQRLRQREGSTGRQTVFKTSDVVARDRSMFGQHSHPKLYGSLV